MRHHAEYVMGTVVSFDIRPGLASPAAVDAALASACAVLHEVDDMFSTWKPDSQLSQLRRGELRVDEVSVEVDEVIDRCVYALRASGGWFDPWSIAGGFDPTGLVKGWAADRALVELRCAGIDAAMINAGGDIATFGTPTPGKTWRIGVRDPLDASTLRVVAEIDGAIATSGAYERGEHVRNPRTGEAARELTSATVTGPELALADALATGLFAAGAAGLQHIDAIVGYEAFIIDADGVGHATSGFPTAPDVPDLAPA
ncbi:MAG: FAD:protein FMN transferase [Thermoleophilia bacterium]|nr:FAD:protein FMN transferase [Thermoleophilia bacterium]